jgi:alpha-ketoglutarate-dependent taurine dioxygenase
MHNPHTPKPSLGKLGSIKRKSLNLPQSGVVKTGYLGQAESLPLVIEPSSDEVDLVDWARNNLDLIEAELARLGGILFRGFDVETAQRFERFASAITPQLFNENGEHPRASVSGNVYTPVFYPPEKQLLWHNENSFNHQWPMKIFFCCVRPADRGGETPLVDSRKVFDALDEGLKRRFIEKGVMYQRNYGDGLGLEWQTVFQTDDRAEVEQMCRRLLLDFEWKPGGRLRTRAVRPAAVKHPRTGQMTWFNQAQHWHISCLDGATRESLLSMFDEQDLPRNCYYGDGSRIEDRVMEEILSVYAELEVVFAWRKNDIVLIDNLLTAHGRNAYRGERKLLVALGEMTSYGDV